MYEMFLCNVPAKVFHFYASWRFRFLFIGALWVKDRISIDHISCRTEFSPPIYHDDYFEHWKKRLFVTQVHFLIKNVFCLNLNINKGRFFSQLQFFLGLHDFLHDTFSHCLSPWQLVDWLDHLGVGLPLVLQILGLNQQTGSHPQGYLVWVDPDTSPTGFQQRAANSSSFFCFFS